MSNGRPPRVIPERADTHTAAVPLPKSRVRNVLPGLTVTRQAAPRVSFAEQAPAQSWRQKPAQPSAPSPPPTAPQRQFSAPQRQPGNAPPLQRQPVNAPPPRQPINGPAVSRLGSGKPLMPEGFRRADVTAIHGGPAPPPPRPRPPQSDPMEPNRDVVFSQTDSSFSRIKNPAKVGEKPADAPKGVPPPPPSAHRPSAAPSQQQQHRVRFEAPRPGAPQSGPQGGLEPHLLEQRVRVRTEELRDLEREERREREKLLYEFHRMEQEGVPMTKRFDQESSLDAMRFEYHKLSADQNIKQGVNLAKRTALLAVNGMEFLNNRFDPFGIQLRGFADEFMSKWDDEYKPDVYRLYKMWNKRSSTNPYMSLTMTFVTQLVMYVINGAMSKSSKLPKRFAPQPAPAAVPQPMPWPTQPYYPPQPQAPPQPMPAQARGYNPYASGFRPPQAPPEAAAPPTAAPQQPAAHGTSVPWQPALAAQQYQQQQQAQAQAQWTAAQQQYAPAGPPAPTPAPTAPGRTRPRVRPPNGHGALKQLIPLVNVMTAENEPPEPVTSVYKDVVAPPEDTEQQEGTKTIEIDENGKKKRSRSKAANGAAFTF